MSITITARSGMTVTMSDEQYAIQRTKHGESAREHILNTAGRVLGHRKTLDKIREQVLTDEQKIQVESLAHALAIQEIINQEIIRLGYSNYLFRAERGGMMPESWDRICSNARANCSSEIEQAKPTDADRNYAMSELGFYTEEDRRWSSSVADWCEWEITAPPEWGVPNPIAELARN